MVAAYGSEGVDAGTLSEQTGLWRDRLTALINPLVREGRLLRQGGHPVRYCMPSPKSAAEKAYVLNCARDIITSEPKGRKEYMPYFAAAAVYSGEQNGLNLM